MPETTEPLAHGADANIGKTAKDEKDDKGKGVENPPPGDKEGEDTFLVGIDNLNEEQKVML